MVITHAKAQKMKWKGETNSLPSDTVPDQAISPQELLRRYATGQPLGFSPVTPVYDDDDSPDIPEFYKLNKLDRLHILQENSERVNDARENLTAYKKAEKQKQFLLEQEKEVEKQQRERKTTNSEATNDE